MTLPSDFASEIETELREAAASVTRDRERLLLLEELHELATALAADIARPITVFDLVRSAPGRAERERRLRLVRCMRGPTASRAPSDWRGQAAISPPSVRSRNLPPPRGGSD